MHFKAELMQLNILLKHAFFFSACEKSQFLYSRIQATFQFADQQNAENLTIADHRRIDFLSSDILPG